MIQTSARFVSVAVAMAAVVMMSGGASAQMIPIAFEEVAAEADTIFLGRTVDRRSRWEENRNGKVIVTQVVFAVEKVYKGTSMAQTSIELLGGTVGDMTFEVEGTPTFNPGDRDVLFLNTHDPLDTPIVGATAGRFKVVRDARRDVDAVTTADGKTFASVGQLGRGPLPAIATVQPMSLQEFEVQIAQALARGKR